MTTLEQHIQHTIQKSHGFMPFSDFMHRALYTPTLGYYMGDMEKLGKQGDFITSPEISPLFSQCLGIWCMHYPHQQILELGAGTGKMAADILLTLAEHKALPERYYILEVSASLQARQKETIQQMCPKLFSRVTWIHTLPTDFKGIIFANEVMDALPVTLFEIRNNTLLEKGVGLENNAFIWKTQPATGELKAYVETLIQTFGENYFCNGYTSEVCLTLRAWINSLSDCLTEGAICLIDYGYEHHEYYRADRHMGTLRCFYQHRAHDNPFIHIGKQDITAHVNFTDAGEAAEAAGLTVEELTPQAYFLINNGLLTRPLGETIEEQFEASQAIKRLTMPTEMGEMFKAMVLTRR